MALDNLIQERLKKLQNIKDAGINPYPAKSDRTHTISEARDLGGEVVYVAGRIRSLRPHGKITFVDLEDFTGRIQLFFSVDTLNGKYDFLKNLDIGDFIEARGEVFTTQAGEITIKVESFDLLTKSIRPLPSQWYGLKDKEERFRKRYLDLILNPDIRERFILKSKFWNNIRKFLLDNRFIEVETPALEPIPGGADARPFVTHHFAQDIDLYLRISLELYQKRLLVGGFEKIFEIGRIFRNEGIDEEHLQDYTQMEFYWAYADNEMLIEFVEKMLKTVIQETLGTLKTTWRGHEIDWSVPWPRVNYTELLNSYWQVDIDKMSVEDLYKLAEKMQIQIESGLGKGRVLDYLYKKTIRPHLIQPQFLINHPIDVSPLAKRIDKDPDKVGRMQLLAMGSELTNGYSELNDPLDQRARFEEQMALRRIGDEEAQMMDLDFVEALEYGMPPAAGFGMSERFFAMLMDQPVREMVFFPTMKAERPENRKFKNKSDDVGEDQIGITRDEAYQLLTEMIANKNLIKHGLAAEVIMRSLARRFGENEEEWAIVGLLHDADYELVEKDSKRHTLVTAEKLSEKGVSERIINAIKAHSDEHKPNRENNLEKAIYAADELAGLITAVALVRPDRKLGSVDVDSVLKKFPQKSFAAGAKREQILTCEAELGIPLEEFVTIALEAMQEISQELGL